MCTLEQIKYSTLQPFLPPLEKKIWMCLLPPLNRTHYIFPYTVIFLDFFFFNYIHGFKKIFIYLFIFGCVGSSFLCEGFLQLWRAGATLLRGARASHYRGLSCCGAQAPDAQAQQLWLTGPVAPRHVGSSQTRARTRVPCIDRQILNHCATREALDFFLNLLF